MTVCLAQAGGLSGGKKKGVVWGFKCEVCERVLHLLDRLERANWFCDAANTHTTSMLHTSSGWMQGNTNHRG